MQRTNPDSLRSCPCFRVFRSNFASDFFDLPIVRFHQAEIIVVKHLMLSKDATTRLEWELHYQPCDHGRRKNDAPIHSATLPFNLSCTSSRKMTKGFSKVHGFCETFWQAKKITK